MAQKKEHSTSFKSWKRSAGLRAFNQKQKKETATLIIVHGFRNQPRSKKALYDWIEEIEQDVPDVQIYLFAFDMRCLLRGDEQELNDLSNRLLADVFGELSFTLAQSTTVGGANLAFIGHSLGSLLVQRAVSASRVNGRRLGSMTTAAYGICFPHLRDDTEWHTYRNFLGEKTKLDPKNVHLRFEAVLKSTSLLETAEVSSQLTHLGHHASVWTFQDGSISRDESERTGSKISMSLTRSPSGPNNRVSTELVAIFDPPPPESEAYKHIRETLKRRRFSIQKSMTEPPVFPLKSPKNPRRTRNLSNRRLSLPVWLNSRTEGGATEKQPLNLQISREVMSAPQLSPKSSRSPKRASFAERPARSIYDSPKEVAREFDAVHRTTQSEFFSRDGESTSAKTPAQSEPISTSPEAPKRPAPLPEGTKKSAVRYGEYLLQKGQLGSAQQLFKILVDELDISRKYMISIRFLLAQTEYYQGKFHSCENRLKQLRDTMHLEGTMKNENVDQDLFLLGNDVSRYLSLSQLKQGHFEKAVRTISSWTRTLKVWKSHLKKSEAVPEQESTELSVKLKQIQSTFALILAYAGHFREALDQVEPLDYQDALDELEQHESNRAEKDQRVKRKKYTIQLDISIVYVLTGKYRKAKEICDRAIPWMERSLGSNHVKILFDYARLKVYALAASNKLQEAERNVQATLRMMCKSSELGPFHPSTLQTIETEASIHRAQGRFADAENALRNLITQYEENTNVGKSHPRTFQARNDLCKVLLSCGKWQESLEEQQRIITDAEMVLPGKAHPITMASRSALIFIYFMRGEYDGGLNHAFKVLADQLEWLIISEKKEKGSDDAAESDSSEVVRLEITHDNIGSFIRGMKFDEQQGIIRIPWETLKHPLTIQTHPCLLDTIHWIALCLQSREDPDVSLAYVALDTVTKIQDVTIGKENIETQSTYADRAINRRLAGYVKESYEELTRIVTFRTRVLGENHPETLWARYQRAEALESLHKHDKAMKEHMDVWAARKFLLGERHPDTIVSQVSVAYHLQETGSANEALALLSPALPWLNKMFVSQGPGLPHRKVIEAEARKAAILCQLERYEEAKVLQERVVDYYRSEQLQKYRFSAYSARQALAKTIQGSGDTGKAIREYNRLLDDISDRKSALYLSVESDLASVYFMDQNYDKAEELQQKVLDATQDNGRSAHSAQTRLVVSYFNLALTKHEKARHGKSHVETAGEDALNLLKKAISIARDVYGNEHRRVRELEFTLKEWKQQEKQETKASRTEYKGVLIEDGV